MPPLVSCLALCLALCSATVNSLTSGEPSPSARNAFRDRCLVFEPQRLVEYSQRMVVEYVTNGTILQFPDNAASCSRPSQLVLANMCRVALYIATSDRSGFTFELWLPDAWSQSRFVATGNGGVDGCIKYEDLAYTAANGFAAMGTNNGHNGTTGVPFLNNPDVIQDFSYRALHTGTVAGKLLAEKYYEKPPAHSYYIGCSLGGRMGIKAAEAFPDDFDGIVAGSPAVDFLHLQGERAMFYPITGPAGSADFIRPELWTGLIHDEVLRQCDCLDGVKDGIIEVPSRCHFVPERLLCRPSGYQELSNRRNCLNSAQIKQLNSIYAPYTAPDGSLIFPRMNPGNELEAVKKFFAGAPFSYSEDWFRYVVLNESKWDAINYNYTLAKMADDQNPFGIRTFPKALPAFKARGGKIIGFHGGQDNQITSFNTERFWDRMAKEDHGLHDYYRFFRISGMFHCNSGPGAWVLGQGGGAAAKGIPFEPGQNVLAAMVAWVENGQAPESLTGTKFVNDTVSKGVDFQRHHCLYPKVQTYIGGNHKRASNWRCL
ncbi:hypothetical protein QQS21_011712 [Conoideocrella luteorostrata]|uniref:Carboxylic ester hydrolase n=1 Tax=Conoideocrella luteorostrata TaxID=1105319 RepID=A0AAJ0FVL4_9HYPO|nr:hypothetical protein QQS21_011712 [Conoideocrella luteorostrata]